MTNDDRSNEDRTGDGNAPVWGSAPQRDQHDAPRYGERVDPAPGSAPQYGEQHQGQPQYGQQQYGQPQYGERDQHGGYDQRDGRQDSPTWGEHQGTHQPYAASSAPASAGGPAWQSYDEPKPAKKKTLGVVAFVLGLVSLVLGVVGGYLMGTALANSSVLGDIARNGGNGSVEQQQQLQQQLMNDPAVMGQLGIGAIVAGIAALIGLWALVQGIIAAVTKRGRGWGVFAIVLAVVATIATFVTYIAVAAAAAVNGAS